LEGERKPSKATTAKWAERWTYRGSPFRSGDVAVHDVFETNSYADDPRADFLNWSIWAAGAFDYPADKIGLTYGAVAELNQQYWALRVGYFLTGNESNANEFDMNLFTRGAYVIEHETRYALFSRPGKLRVGIWADTYFSGSYTEFARSRRAQSRSWTRPTRSSRPAKVGPSTATTSTSSSR
jgi:high affinity Mn2+ porin